MRVLPSYLENGFACASMSAHAPNNHGSTCQSRTVSSISPWLQPDASGSMNTVFTRFALCLLLLIHPLTGVLHAASAGTQPAADRHFDARGFCCQTICECEPALCCVTDNQRLPEPAAPLLSLSSRDATFGALKPGSYPDCKDPIALRRGKEATAASFSSVALSPGSLLDHQRRRAMLCSWLN